MTIQCVEVVFYVLPAGGCPVRDFLDGLPPKVCRKAFWTLEAVQAFGRASSQYFKCLVGTDGLYEVRVTAHRGDLRLIGFFGPRSKFILLNGFLKKTQETPQREIAVAQQRRKDYLARCEHETR